MAGLARSREDIEKIIAGVHVANDFNVSMRLTPVCTDENGWAVQVQLDGPLQPFYRAWSIDDIRCIARAAQCHLATVGGEEGQVEYLTEDSAQPSTNQAQRDISIWEQV